uniref:flavin reductase family protein n=1 Tax=Actinosynnema sp. TaxID=1872144 RepID=UPI003F83BD4B
MGHEVARERAAVLEAVRGAGSDRTALPGAVRGAGLDPARLRAAFGAFPSGVVAVAAEVDGGLVGLCASSFTSVSLDPPLVSFSIATGSRTWPSLRGAARIGVTVLADHHGPVARQLAGPAEDRFTGLDAVVGEGGAVTLPDGVAWFEASPERGVEAGDHTIVLLRLHSAAHTPGTPLVFHRSGFGLRAGERGFAAPQDPGTSTTPGARPPLRPLSECDDVYDVLRDVQARPSTWVRSLRELETALWGYGVALQVHGIAEPHPFGGSRGFSDWLRERFGWALERGWARAIE